MFRRALVPGRQICCALPSFTERGPTVGLQSKRFKGDSRPDQVSEKFDLDGRVFAITGGARGLGLAMAEGLLGAGGEGEAAPRFRLSISFSRFLCVGCKIISNSLNQFSSSLLGQVRRTTRGVSGRARTVQGMVKRVPPVLASRRL